MTCKKCNINPTVQVTDNPFSAATLCDDCLSQEADVEDKLCRELMEMGVLELEEDNDGN